MVITVYKDGKLGIYTKDLKEIIPPIYDNIGFARINLLENFYEGKDENRNKNFYIIKKDNLFGQLSLRFNYETLDYDIDLLIEPVFDEYPVYYYKNYFNSQNLYLLVFGTTKSLRLKYKIFDTNLGLN